jgi:hypothetical protein
MDRRLRFALTAAASTALAAAIAQGCAKAGGGTGDGGACTAPQVACGSSCVELGNDPNNCGACGKACGYNEVCSQGQCGSSCSAGTLCTPDGGKAICALLDSDPKNCGSCGKACNTGATCTGGQCVGGTPTCPTGQTSCPAPDGGTACFDTQTDESHCGDCNTTCIPNLEVCTEGKCASTCTGGKTLCVPDGGTVDGGPMAHCADLQNDDTDCGSCFNPCSNGAQCQAGKCVSTLLGSGTASDPWHTATALADCAAYKTQFPSATSGVYTTHPNNADIGVYCDMTGNGVTYEDFGFGQYSATYTGYTVLAAGDFSGSSQVDAAFAYLYTRNGGLTNINPGGWTDANCCIENGTTTSSFYGLAGGTYMYPAVNGSSDCATSYTATTIELQIWTSQVVKTSFTASEAGNVGTSSTCSTSGNPAIFVKKY